MFSKHPRRSTPTWHSSSWFICKHLKYLNTAFCLSYHLYWRTNKARRGWETLHIYCRLNWYMGALPCNNGSCCGRSWVSIRWFRSVPLPPSVQVSVNSAHGPISTNSHSTPMTVTSRQQTGFLCCSLGVLYLHVLLQRSADVSSRWSATVPARQTGSACCPMAPWQLRQQHWTWCTASSVQYVDLFQASVLQVASSHEVLTTPLGTPWFEMCSYARDMLGRLSHEAAKRVEQHEETALVCWGYRMVAGLDISHVHWSWRLRRDAEA